MIPPPAGLRARDLAKSSAATLVYRSAAWPWTRRIRANLIYLRRPLRDFLPLLMGMALLVLLGGLAFHLLYTDPKTGAPLAFGRAVYITYCLIFMEHLLEWPDHWLLEAFYVGLPPLGLVVILDGLVRFGYHILRRDETGREWVAAVAQTLDDHVVLCGLGKVGLRILQELVRLGEKVIVLEKDERCENLAYAREHGIAVRIGGGREAGLFDDLQVKHAKAIICATDDDLANLEMALDAREARPGIRVVMRMYDHELAQKIRDGFDIHLAFSTANTAAPLFATSASDRSIASAFYVGDRLLVVADITVHVDSALAGKHCGDVSREQTVFVLSHQRDREMTLHPADETTIAVGDRITIQCEPARLKKIHVLNKDPAYV